MAAVGLVPDRNGRFRRGAAAAAVLEATLLTSWMRVANAQPDAAPDAAPGSDPNEGNPCSIGWYRAHGWLMWLAFGIFLPLGVMISRFGQKSSAKWLWAHVALQVTGVILSTAAFIIAVRKFEVDTWDTTHVKLGLAIMVVVWLQLLAGLIKPRKRMAIRTPWFVLHWLFGTAAIILAWFNIFKGLDVYVEDWPAGGERKTSYVLWGVQVAILAFLYLFFERLPYIRSQAWDPNANPTSSTKSTTESTYKSTGGSETRAAYV